MPTYSDFSQLYARRILAAIQEDGLAFKDRVSEADLVDSNTLQILKSVKREIDSIVYEGTKNRLSRQDRERIYRGISQELHLPTLQKSIDLCEAASNDDLTDLVDTIDNILKNK